MWGVYVGELIEIFGSPWRGKVKIISILQYPTQGKSQYSAGIKIRKPYKYGEVRDFGNSSIAPYTDPVIPYDESLKKALISEIKRVENYIETAKRDEFLNLPYGIELKSLEILEQHLREIEGKAQRE